jgi:hypothetical protein
MAATGSRSRTSRWCTSADGASCLATLRPSSRADLQRRPRLSPLLRGMPRRPAPGHAGCRAARPARRLLRPLRGRRALGGARGRRRGALARARAPGARARRSTGLRGRLRAAPRAAPCRPARARGRAAAARGSVDRSRPVGLRGRLRGRARSGAWTRDRDPASPHSSHARLCGRLLFPATWEGRLLSLRRSKAPGESIHSSSLAVMKKSRSADVRSDLAVLTLSFLSVLLDFTCASWPRAGAI